MGSKIKFVLSLVTYHRTELHKLLWYCLLGLLLQSLSFGGCGGSGGVPCSFCVNMYLTFKLSCNFCYICVIVSFMCMFAFAPYAGFCVCKHVFGQCIGPKASKRIFGFFGRSGHRRLHYLDWLNLSHVCIIK